MSDRDDISVSTRIVVAVAAAKGVDPLSLSPPLADELDVDALDRLCATAGAIAVSFTAWGHRITVRDNRVTDVAPVTPPSVPAD